MIRYELQCGNGDSFEAWFAGSADYDRQAAAGLVECPHCGTKQVSKAPMAPAVLRRRSKKDTERKVAIAMAEEMRTHIRDNYDYVGDQFADEARKIHDGETDHRNIWGEATPEDAKRMVEEGLPVAPLPPGLAPTPPRKLN